LDELKAWMKQNGYSFPKFDRLIVKCKSLINMPERAQLQNDPRLVEKFLDDFRDIEDMILEAMKYCESHQGEVHLSHLSLAKTQSSDV